jgi:hypothetical protein
LSWRRLRGERGFGKRFAQTIFEIQLVRPYGRGWELGRNLLAGYIAVIGIGVVLIQRRHAHGVGGGRIERVRLQLLFLCRIFPEGLVYTKIQRTGTVLFAGQAKIEDITRLYLAVFSYDTEYTDGTDLFIELFSIEAIRGGNPQPARTMGSVSYDGTECGRAKRTHGGASFQAGNPDSVNHYTLVDVPQHCYIALASK